MREGLVNYIGTDLTRSTLDDGTGEFLTNFFQIGLGVDYIPKGQHKVHRMRNHQTRLKFSDIVEDCVVCGNY